MRPKELQCVVTFKTTTGAMVFEQAAKEAGFGGRIIPVPTEITAGCGLAWRDDPDCLEILRKFIAKNQLDCEGIYQLVI